MSGRRNLVLGGYIGIPLTAIGQQLAARLALPLVEIAARAEALAGLPLAQIQEEFGAARLKTLEEAAMSEALLRRGAVILASGHALMQGAWLRRFRETGPVLCLVATLDAFLQRLHRHMGDAYADPDARAQALAQLRRDAALRGQPGVLELDVSALDESEIPAAVIQRWQATLREEETEP